MKKTLHFLEGLDRDLQEGLLRQLNIEWTHHSTGLEGNTLSLGETEYVLTQGLTIDGKPLKDHNEVVGHGRAVEWIIAYAIHGRAPMRFDDLFDLHRLVQTEAVTDIFQPMGAWKAEPNGTMSRDAQGNAVFTEFAPPQSVAFLMGKWIEQMNTALLHSVDEGNAPAVFCSLHTGFTAIHPFFDGNGRMARLLANLPLLRSGLPPIVIKRTYAVREKYIALLQEVQRVLGTLSKDHAPLPIASEILHPLTVFCTEQWVGALELVKMAHRQQKARST